MRSIEYSSQGVWVAEVAPTKRVDEFPPCHLVPYVFASVKCKIILTHDYRKEKEESKETMALNIVTDGKDDKTEQND